MHPIDLTHWDVRFAYADDGPASANEHVDDAVSEGYTHLAAVVAESGFAKHMEADSAAWQDGGLWLVFTKLRKPPIFQHAAPRTDP